MDRKDEEILEILKKDGRISYTEIADEIGVSEGTVRNRVEKMEESGVIKNFTVNVSEDLEVNAFVNVNVSTDREFADVVGEFPDNIEVFEVAGDIDIILKISRSSTSELNKVVDLIRGIEGVESTKTHMVMSKDD